MKMPMMNGGPDNPPVPMFSKRKYGMGRQFYLGPRLWILVGGDAFPVWLTIGRLSVNWSASEQKRKELRRKHGKS